MMDKNKKCKYCQSDIPIEAKVCPICRKTQGIKTWQIVIIVIIALGVLGNLFGHSDSSSNTTNTSSANSAE